jgi:hypothetical protein
MLYDQAKRDIFSSPSPTVAQHKPLPHSHDSSNIPNNKADQDANAPVHAPSVTTIVLLQVQASMIQVISKLKTQKKGITTAVQVPIRWGLLFGLLVVDNVARALQVDQEMACLQHSDEQTNSDGNTVTEEEDIDEGGSLTYVEDLMIGGASYQHNHHHHHHTHHQTASYPPLPQRSQSATTANTKHYHNYPFSLGHQPSLSTSVSSSLPTSPLLAIRPPMVSQSSEGLRVRLRKVSSPPVMTNDRPVLSNLQPQRVSVSSNNLHDTTRSGTSSTRPLPTVRRITAQRDLAVASPPGKKERANKQTKAMTV